MIGRAEPQNEDLLRKYQALLAYVFYSQAVRGAEYTIIAGKLEVHAHDELKHALIISRQINVLGNCRLWRPGRANLEPAEKTCFALTSKTKTRPFASIATAFASAKRSEIFAMAKQLVRF
jgi:bacterioferritin